MMNVATALSLLSTVHNEVYSVNQVTECTGLSIHSRYASHDRGQRVSYLALWPSFSPLFIRLSSSHLLIERFDGPLRSVTLQSGT